MDILLAWRVERCEKSSNNNVSVWADDLFEDMMSFYSENTEENVAIAMKKMTEAKFRKALQNADFEVLRTQRNKQNAYRVYGIRIKKELLKIKGCIIEDSEDELD